MFFTRSIRRKMITGAALVTGALVMLAISGFSGMISYRQVVNDLDYSIRKAPRRADLIASVGPLFEPLLDSRDSESAIRTRQNEFQERLKTARSGLREFSSRLQNEPVNLANETRLQISRGLINGITADLNQLDKLLAEWKARSDHQAVLTHMLGTVAVAHTRAQRMPDPQAGLISTLNSSRKVYRSRLVMVGISSILAVLLLIGLTICGYYWIFVPIRKLHEGARRVAQDDYDYRVEIKSRDEMAELAEAFNSMTVRFQEVYDNLDQQVQEQSRQLVRSERLAGVGFLSAGVSHEINNPLSAITMAVDSIQERMLMADGALEGEDATIAGEYLEMIQKEARRCQGITSRLLDFTREQDAVRMQTDVTELIFEVLDLVKHLGKFKDREIVFHPPGAVRIVANPAELKQVFLNLVSNAMEAMDTGGELVISLRELHDRVLIQFVDNGCGMSEDVCDHVFEPFFTRRRNGKGTGLGLSITHRIVTDHQGTIDVDSAEGRGTTFKVSLPRTAEIASAA